MAGKTQYERAKELIDILKEDWEIIPRSELKRQILMKLSMDCSGYLKLMAETGLIRECETGWIINNDKPKVQEGLSEREENNEYREEVRKDSVEVSRKPLTD